MTTRHEEFGDVAITGEDLGRLMAQAGLSVERLALLVRQHPRTITRRLAGELPVFGALEAVVRIVAEVPAARTYAERMIRERAAPTARDQQDPANRAGAGPKRD